VTLDRLDSHIHIPFSKTKQRNQIEEALNVINKMKSLEMEPEIDHYNMLIKYYIDKKDYQQALHVFIVVSVSLLLRFPFSSFNFDWICDTNQFQYMCCASIV
jgi:hypothetical protein